jgi:hypothetical protein
MCLKVASFDAPQLCCGVLHFQDVEKVISDEKFESEIRAIPGQASGISLKYFFMLAGSDDLVKPDRHILAFIHDGLGRIVRVPETQALLETSCQYLQTEFSHLTLRLLDNSIWDYKRNRVGKKHIRVCKPIEPDSTPVVTKDGRFDLYDVAEYVRRFMDNHEQRLIPKVKTDLTDEQAKVYKVIKT